MKSSVVFFLSSVSFAHCKVQCYDCLTPKNPVNWNSYCSEKKFCYGEYCTRGPNAKSNGILHGCSSTPPLDGDNARSSKMTTLTQTVTAKTTTSAMDQLFNRLFLPLSLQCWSAFFSGSDIASLYRVTREATIKLH